MKQRLSQIEEKRIADLYLDIGKNILRLRRAKGWNQEKLAKKIKTTKTSIISMEKGEHRIALHNAFYLAQAFGVTIGEILKLPLESPFFDATFILPKKALDDQVK